MFPAGYVGPLRPLVRPLILTGCWWVSSPIRGFCAAQNATPLSAEASTPSFALEDFKPRSLLSFTTSSAIFTADWDRQVSACTSAIFVCHCSDTIPIVGQYMRTGLRSGSPSVPATLHVDWSTDAIESREGNLLRRELKVYAALSVKKHVLGLLGHFTGTLPAAWLKLSTPAVAVSPRLVSTAICCLVYWSDFVSILVVSEYPSRMSHHLTLHRKRCKRPWNRRFNHMVGTRLFCCISTTVFHIFLFAVVIAESDAGVLSEPNPVSAPLSRRPLKLPPIRIDPFNAGSYPLPTPRSLAGHSVPSSRSSARDTDVRITVFSPRSNGGECVHRAISVDHVHFCHLL